MSNVKTKTKGIYLIINDESISYDSFDVSKHQGQFDEASLSEQVELFAHELKGALVRQTIAYCGFVFKAKNIEVKQINGRKTRVIALFQNMEKLND